MRISDGCIKCLVVACNLILALLGIFLLSCGIFLLVGSNKVINAFLEKNSFENVTGHCPDNANTTAEPPKAVNFSELFHTLSVVLIVFGVFISLVGLAGACGVCCSSRALLILYAITIILIVVAELVISILFFVNTFDGEIQKQLKNTLTKHYEGINTKEPYSMAWNYIMNKYECCGMDNYTDFWNATRWQCNGSKPANLGCEEKVSLKVPYACLQSADATLNIKCAYNTTNNHSSIEAQQQHNATIHLKGCWEKVKTRFLPYRTTVIGIICAVVVSQVLLAIMAAVIAWSLHKEDY